MTPEEIGRRLLGPGMLTRLERHLAPSLVEDLCQHVAAVVRAEREACARIVEAGGDGADRMETAIASGPNAAVAEGIRARGTS